ncbi:hypothetical protein B0T11DRAFT_322085 [Plectosphaerella cucumerina]|uniref:Ankyrin repeat protein n=1 Tax=Plectosphaerella cucumerina TaxID=40658 RepID=A0A8K0T4Z1_9PEZI|nr:hypothetical protein B0T11DRAFT_322085 [Plectosphaerella cucumerina]
MASFHRDALTLSAEVFAVVGVADVVLRQLIALTNLATAAANASRTAREMRVRLQSLAGAILAVRTWAESYAGSDFATRDNQRISANVTETLLQCSTRLGAISKNLHDVESRASGTLARFWTGFRFARDEQAHHQAMTDLMSYTSALQLAMQSRQGTDLAIIRHQQTLHAQSTAENHDGLKAGVDTLLHTTSTHAEATQSHHTAMLARLDNLQLTQVKASSQLVATNTEAIKAGFSDIQQRQAAASESLLAATQATLQACTDAVMTTVRLTHLNDYEVLVEGEKLGAGVDALHYLNKYLSHSLRSLAESDGGLILPRDLAASLTNEIDKMIKYSQHFNRCGTTGLLAGSGYHFPQRIHTISVKSQARANHDDGFIAINSVEGEDPLGRRFQHIRFTAFSVKPSGDGSAIFGRISRIHVGIGQQIRRQLRLLNILPRDSPVFSFAANNNVDVLKRLFAEGKASILDYDEDGLGLLWHASRGHSWATLHLLLDLGADASECSVRPSWFSSIGFTLGHGIDLAGSQKHIPSVPEFPSEFKTCWNFLQLVKVEATQTGEAAAMLFATFYNPHNQNKAIRTAQKEHLFSILWDSGLGRRRILGLICAPCKVVASLIAAITAWVRTGALRENPGISDTNGRSILHLLLLASSSQDGATFEEQLVFSMEDSQTDWERVCRATFYAHMLGWRGWHNVRTTLERLLRLFLESGVHPLQKDKEGVSAWDIARSSAFEGDRKFYSHILEPFV